MKRHVLILMLVCASSLAGQATKVQLRPMNFNTTVLGNGYYRLLDTNDIRVTAYSAHAQVIASDLETPGQIQLDLEHLPPNTVQIGQNTYQLLVDDVLLTIWSKQALPLSSPTSKILSTMLSKPAGTLPRYPQSVLNHSTPTPLRSLNVVKYPLPTLIPATPPPTLIVIAQEKRQTIQEPMVPSTEKTLPTVTSITKTVEDRGHRLQRLPGLPDEITGNINVVQTPTRTIISYSLINLGGKSYSLDVDDLRLSQDGIGVSAHLERKDGSLSPGLLSPGKGEMGRITVPRVSSAPLKLTWTLRSGDTRYILQKTYSASVISP